MLLSKAVKMMSPEYSYTENELLITMTQFYQFK